jgi:hypothetical protein
LLKSKGNNKRIFASIPPWTDGQSSCKCQEYENDGLFFLAGISLHRKEEDDIFTLKIKHSRQTDMTALIRKKQGVLPVIFILLLFFPGILFSQQVIRFRSGNESTVLIVYQTIDTVRYRMIADPSVTYTERMSRIDRIRSLKHPDWDYIQLIRIRDGNEFEAGITYLSADTLRFWTMADTSMIRTLPMQEVESIRTMASPASGGQKVLSGPLAREDSLMRNKINRFENMTITGACLAGGGIVVAGLAAALIVASTNQGDDPDEEGNEAYGDKVGTGVAVAGACMVISGTVVMINGIVKTKKYKSKLHNLSFGLTCSPNQTGIALKYKF